MEPNDFKPVHTIIIESRDTIFDENRFSSITRLSELHHNASKDNDFSN